MEEKEDGWWRFVETCARVRDPKQMDELFGFFLTFAEREALGLRFALVKALLEGEKSQREIADELGVSIAKITRGSNALKTATKNTRRLIKAR